MRFAHKLTLIIIVILAVSLALAGFFSVSQNFDMAIENAVSQNRDVHLLERYMIESQLAETMQSTKKDSEEVLKKFTEQQVKYIGAESREQIIYDDEYKEIFTSLKVNISERILTAIKNGETGGYLQISDNDRTYMVFISEIASTYITVFLASSYDITNIYIERDRQMSYTLKIDGIILLAASIAIILASIMLTRPINKLNKASKKIALGTYEARTDIMTDDEVGELANSFNIMAAAVEEQVEELSLSVKQREDFISAFTHEIKTPMTAIIGYADMIRFKETTPELRQKASSFIYREANRLEALSQKLLLLMGLSNDSLELKYSSLEQIFRKVASSVQPLLLEENIELKYVPIADTYVKADTDLIVDLLRNLILNSVKAEPVDATVYIRAEDKGDKVKISVIDKGKGIPKDEAERILEPFYMIDKSRARKDGSSGIGLSLCQKICELHGTNLEIESKIEKGTKVSFYLSKR